MPHYKAALQRTLSASASVGAINAPGSGMRVIYIDTLCFSSEATPAEVAVLWRAQRCTTAGTAGSAVTPEPNDPATSACLAVVGQAHSAEPTYTANKFLITRAVHQRATSQWAARDDSDRLVVPATANNGIGILTPTLNGGTPVGTCELGFTE